MRPPKFAIAAGNTITSSIYLCDLLVCNRSRKLYNIINILMRPPKFATEAEKSITSSIYLCDLLNLQ